MKEPESSSHPVATSRLFGNTTWNVASSALPLIAGVFAIPVLLKDLGTQRFGILTLAWAAIGYLGFLDLGLGRAITKFSSEKLAIGEGHTIPCIFWDALWILILIGAASGLAIGAFAQTLTVSVLRVSGPFQPETVTAVRIIGLSVPLVTIGVAFRSVLEARQAFAGISIIKAGAGFLGFLVPVAVLPLAPRLDVVVATLGAVRLLMVIALGILAAGSFPGILKIRSLRPSGLLRLLRYGGWVTVSSVISPLMGSMDRFLIGALASVSAVAYYVTPQEMATKLLVIPIALQTALFPVFSGLAATNPARRSAVYERSMAAIVAVMLPATLAIMLLAREALTLWLGADFASHSYRAAQILAFSLFVNSIAHIPAVLIESGGRPDICAKLHLVEFPLYAVLCGFLITSVGIEGAAVAGLCRVTADAALLMYVARPWVRAWPWRPSYSLIAICILGGGVVLAVTQTSLAPRLFYIALAACISLWQSSVKGSLLGAFGSTTPSLHKAQPPAKFIGEMEI
jgi:O-antigen/teichoic acid export membrane protein